MFLYKDPYAMQDIEDVTQTHLIKKKFSQKLVTKMKKATNKATCSAHK